MPWSAQRRNALFALLIALSCFLIYNCNLRSIPSGDTVSTRFLPFAIVRYHTLSLDPVFDAASGGNPAPYWMWQGTHGRAVSLYPVVTPVLLAPLYLPAVLWLDRHGWTTPNIDFVSRVMEKFSASLLASLAAGLMFLLLRRRLGERDACLLTIAFALGTNQWAVSSQALWQHPMAVLLLTVALLLVTGPFAGWRAFLLGVLLPLIAFNRPPDAIFSAGIAVYCAWWAARGERLKCALLVVAGALPLGALLLYYNVHIVGNVYGGYVVVMSPGFFRHNIPAGIASMLFSPARGLFVFSPFLLALLPGVRAAFRGQRERPLAIIIGITFVLQLVVYARSDWRGGHSWGARYLTDALPLLIWLLAPALPALGRVSRSAFAALVALSIGFEVVGAFWYNHASDVLVFADYEDLSACWQPHNFPVLVELRHPRAPRDLFQRLEGAVDFVTLDGAPLPRKFPAGGEIALGGWALMSGRTPGVVIITLFRTRSFAPIASYTTNAFTFRSDVSKALGTDAPCAWRVTIPTAALPPGHYYLTPYVFAATGGEQTPLPGIEFDLLPPAPTH